MRITAPWSHIRRRTHVVPGNTLLELLIYIGILATVIIGVIMIIGEMFRIQAKVRGAFVLRENMDYVSQRLSYGVQGGYDIVSPATGTGSWLRIQMSTSSSDTLDFGLSDGRVTMSVRNETPVPITSSEVEITSLTFQRLQGTPPTLRFFIDGNLRGVDQSYQVIHEIKGISGIRR